jgi:hypothetical protein
MKNEPTSIATPGTTIHSGHVTPPNETSTNRLTSSAAPTITRMTPTTSPGAVPRRAVTGESAAPGKPQDGGTDPEGGTEPEGTEPEGGTDPGGGPQDGVADGPTGWACGHGAASAVGGHGAASEAGQGAAPAPGEPGVAPTPAVVPVDAPATAAPGAGSQGEVASSGAGSDPGTGSGVDMRSLPLLPRSYARAAHRGSAPLPAASPVPPGNRRTGDPLGTAGSSGREPEPDPEGAARPVGTKLLRVEGCRQSALVRLAAERLLVALDRSQVHGTEHRPPSFLRPRRSGQ